MQTATKLVIFDIDGTLLDSQALILEAMAGAFATADREMPTRAEVLGIVGLSLPEAIATLVPGLDPAENAALVTSYKRSFLALREARGGEADAAMYPGARDMVHALSARGFVLSAATGKARRGLTHFLNSHGLSPLFTGTQSADDAPSKPHPGMVLNCLSATGVAPENAVIVGDTEFDMAMGLAAGVRRIGVDWGYHPRERVMRGGAEAIAEDFEHLDRLVTSLWEAA